MSEQKTRSEALVPFDRVVWSIFQRFIAPSATRGPYNVKSKGIPSEVYWDGRLLWPSDGGQFCSGAAWWALVEILRFAGLESMSQVITPSLLETLRKFAWVWDDREHHGGIPQGLVNNGLGVWICEGEVSPDPSLFVEGRFFQYWSSWAEGIGYKGHTGIIAQDADPHGGFFEWSSSPLLQLSPDKKPQSIASNKWYIASLHPDISSLLSRFVEK